MGLCKRLFLVLSSVTCVSHGCKDRNTNGNLKHEWGKTRVEPPAELAACTATLKTKFPKASQYLVNLAKIIATANPGTFSGVYDLSKFCFDVYYDPEVGKEANTVNGFAQPWDRRLVLFPTTFTFAKSDADIAGILTHELAHITMYHNGQARQAERVMYQMRNDGEYKRLQADVNRLEEELRHADAGQNDHYEKNKSIFQHLNDDLENDQKYQTLVQKARSSVFSSSYTLQAALGFALWRLTGDPEFAEFDNGYRGQEFEHSGTQLKSPKRRDSKKETKSSLTK
ncbi:MAG: M48 family metalloprotease [Proteobacteria bacterium]|nr:M48 family metalloprotease [Pseudomonadota bacterium]